MDSKRRAINWSDQELQLLLENYKSMLEAELQGLPYVKRKYNEDLAASTGRSAAAIEFKLCNVSAALLDMGKIYIKGYKPRTNYQRRLYELLMTQESNFPPRVEDYTATEKALMTRKGTRESTDQRRPSNASPESGRAGQDGHDTTVSDIYLTSEVVEDCDPNIAFWERVSTLWSRATGGEEVADKPFSDAVSPSQDLALKNLEGPRPAGLDEAGKWFAQAIEKSNVPNFLFLIGGPGAGKSHMAASLVRDYACISDYDENLAHRSYEYSGIHRNILLINDATIPNSKQPLAPLTNEVARSLTEGKDLIACVNRGILVEEIHDQLKAEPTSSDMKLAATLLRYINDASRSEYNIQDLHLSLQSRSSFIRSGRIERSGQCIARIMAVYVDVCSLLEKRPWVEILPTGEAVSPEYPTIDSTGFEEMRSGSPAGKLLEQVIDYLDLPEQARYLESTNPIIANITSLEKEEIREGFLAALRSAEIYCGKRFTYREIWGAIVRAIIGDLSDSSTPTDVQEKSSVDPTVLHSPSAKTRFDHLIQLAHLRYSNAIFGTPCKPDPSRVDPIRNPVTKLLSKVDPLLDAVAGDPTNTNSKGWVSPITSALGSYGQIESPLVILQKDTDTQCAFTSIGITNFEEALDQAFQEVIEDSSTSESDRAKYISWYGAHLIRLYAIFNRISAFQEDINLWVRTWRSGSQIPNELEAGLRTLLRPRRNPGEQNSRSLLPVFDSRTTPITGHVTQPKLTISTESFDLSPARNGEEIELRIKENGVQVGRIELDVALIREARSSADNFAGVTEMSSSTLPRLERVRAERLVPSNLTTDYYRLAINDKDYIVLVRPDIAAVRD